MVTPRLQTGVALSLLCLGLLGVMPIITDSRPPSFDALAFALLLSLWQSLFAVPLFVRSMRGRGTGPFASGGGLLRGRATAVALGTGMIFGLSTYLYVLAVEKAGTVNAAIAIQSYPIFAILIETIFLRRRKTPMELALTGVLIAAVYMLGTGGTGRVDGLTVWFGVALAVPLLWSIAHVIIKEELGRTSVTPAQITFFRVLISSVFLAVVIGMVDPSLFLTDVFRPEYQLVGAIMGLVYYLELILWFHAVRHIDVSLASSITTPWPAVTMLLAVVFLAEAIAPYQIVCFVVIAASIYGLLLAGARKQRLAEADGRRGS